MLVMASILPDSLTNTIKSMDANRYATKKTVAQGMLDIALLTANASQLKYILQVGHQHEFYTLMLVLISISICMQLLVGILYVVIASMNINRNKHQRAATILNDVLLVLVFTISLINIIISGFGIEYSSQPLRLLEREQTPLNSLSAILAIILTQYDLNENDHHRLVANRLTHISLGMVFVSMFCDIIKMNFGLDPAVRYVQPTESPVP